MNVEVAAATAASDFTLWAMFMQATLTVKLVMIGLVVASVVCWAIVFEKFLSVRRMRRAVDAFEALFWSGRSLNEIDEAARRMDSHGPTALFIAAMDEWRRSRGVTAGPHGLLERIEKIMDVELHRQLARLERYLLVLATVGSIAPFVGLFGTVWGIMNSFQAIAISKNTNLAVVAPGLAEALFATALGLLAAIPAVIFYNKFSHDISRLGSRMENFIDEFTTIIGRQLEGARPPVTA